MATIKPVKIAQVYHSGLREADDAPIVHHTTFDGGEAFVHDIKHGFPTQFVACDVIYAEPPWKVGFKEFNRRAGGEVVRTFELLCGLIGNAVVTSPTPVYLVCGEAGLKYYPDPEQSADILLHGAPAKLLVWRGPLPDESDKRLSSEQVLHWLANRFNCAGDFCCGYGQTGMAFVAAGKRCVLSDYNPRCIGHISIHATNWHKRAA